VLIRSLLRGRWLPRFLRPELPPVEPGVGGVPRSTDAHRSYELLLSGTEPLEQWSVCTICLHVERSGAVSDAKRRRCADCGSTPTADSPQLLTAYLAQNPPETLETNLRQWTAIKGMRPAYKMLRAARYKCLLTLSRRVSGGQ
jgi:hypothetical protein